MEHWEPWHSGHGGSRTADSSAAANSGCFSLSSLRTNRRFSQAR
jgi:hypothetical protein